LALAGAGGGQISGQGSLSIPSEGANGTKQIQSNADINLKNWNLTPLLAIGAALSGTPSGTGILNGQFQVEGDPTSGLHLTGQLSGADIRLTGGKLASDTPSLKK